MELDIIAPKIYGKKIILGPLRSDLNDTYRRWLHDMDIGVNLYASRLLTREQEAAWLEKVGETSDVIFTIYMRENRTPVGTSGLHGIDPINRTAEFGFMIGEKKFHNLGLGTEAALLTVDYGFNVLNLASIFLRVHSFNTRALKIYEKIGFKKCGVRRRAYYLGGRYYADVYMDIIPEEFKESIFRDMIGGD